MHTKYSDRYREIGRKISYYRNKIGLSQQELADKINISKSYMSKIEAPKSEKPCSIEVLFDIANALGVDITLLFDTKDLEE